MKFTTKLTLALAEIKPVAMTRIAFPRLYYKLLLLTLNFRCT